jgi:hypothetical protein
MGTTFGLVVIALSLICWIGQAISWFAPARATDLGLMEAEDDVEPAFYGDSRGEALWDTLTLWTMVVAGALLVADHPAWPHFGLIGGAMYLYFAGRGIMTRHSLSMLGLRIGTTTNVKAAYVFLAIWGVMAVTMIAAAIAALPTP